jgi:hypothetical protein
VFFHCLHGTGQQMRCQHLWLLFEDSTDVLTLSLCVLSLSRNNGRPIYKVYYYYFVLLVDRRH